MTGMTSRGIGSQRLKHDYVALSDLLSRALIDMGHTVDIGRVSPDEDLDQYDAALVLTYWVSSLSSHYVHETAVALSKLQGRAIVYSDDWRAQTLADDFYNHVEKPIGWSRHRDRFRKALWDKLTERQVEEGREALLQMIRPDSPYEMLVPQHPWGDIAKFHQSKIRALTNHITPIDPTPMVPLPELVRRRASDRDRAWVLATIQEHERWLQSEGFEWDVVKLGGAKKLGGGVNPGRAEMSKVVPEKDVIQAYADNWGMLVPPYACSGSGWWRPRYTYAAHARAVTYAPIQDALLLGDAYTLDRGTVEGLSSGALRGLAEEQAGVQEGYAWSRELLYSTLESVLRVAASKSSS